jgi:hypothetical protein
MPSRATHGASPRSAAPVRQPRLIDNITVLKGSDLESQGRGGLASLRYRKEVPLVSNVGLYIDFAANSAGQ